VQKAVLVKLISMTTKQSITMTTMFHYSNGPKSHGHSLYHQCMGLEVWTNSMSNCVSHHALQIK